MRTILRKLLCLAAIVSFTPAPAGCAVARAPFWIYRSAKRHKEHVEAKKWREEQKAEKERAREADRPWQEQQGPTQGMTP